MGKNQQFNCCDRIKIVGWRKVIPIKPAYAYEKNVMLVSPSTFYLSPIYKTGCGNSADKGKIQRDERCTY